MITFVYLNNKDNIATNPMNDMSASNPLPLYFTILITNITNNTIATPATK